MSENEPVDAVIMWVDGEDEIFRRQHANYAGIVAKIDRKHESAARHRDSGELVYCLRGIQDNMPWIRRIHIVTSGQIPPGLDFDDPRLRLVIHSDIFPDLSVLPTFNSFAIDSCLHRIPELAPRFIRFSDDFLAISPVAPEDLLGADGAGQYYFGHLVPDLADAQPARTNHLATLAYNRFMLAATGILAVHAPLHVPQMRRIETCLKLANRFKVDIQRTRAARFRTDRDLSMLFVYPHFVAAQKKAARDDNGRHGGPAFSYYTWAKARQALVGDKDQAWRAVIRKAKEDAVLFLNINDHLGGNPAPQALQDFRALMEDLLPNPAPWERPVPGAMPAAGAEAGTGAEAGLDADAGAGTADLPDAQTS